MKVLFIFLFAFICFVKSLKLKSKSKAKNILEPKDNFIKFAESLFLNTDGKLKR